MPSMQQPLLTSDEVAKILKVSRSYAYLMMKRGDLPVVHVGHAIRVRPEDLERYIHNNVARCDSRRNLSLMKIEFSNELQ